MKVKIGSTIYDGLNEPIMVILTERDKKGIAKLDKDDMKFCHYPTGIDIKIINEWMNQDSKLNKNPFNEIIEEQRLEIGKLIVNSEALQRKMKMLKPFLLDTYVQAILAGGITERELNGSKPYALPFDIAEGLIKERNKRLNANPQ